MQSPQGSVVALSASSATILSVGMLFLGYWGFMEPPPWTFSDFCVIVPALFGLGIPRDSSVDCDHPSGG